MDTELINMSSEKIDSIFQGGVLTGGGTPSGHYMDTLLTKADGAGLLWEVVYFGLWHMKKNPELSEEEALELGYHEWMK